jgi:hypothetical protein
MRFVDLTFFIVLILSSGYVYVDWFPATITSALPFDATYNVLYDDGDQDKDMTRKCMELQ